MGNEVQEHTKEQLETRKLTLEIEELQKPLYFKASFYAVLGPTMLALATLGVGFYTGLFNIQNERIRNETTLLKIQEYKLNSEVAQLRLDVDAERKGLIAERQRMQTQLSEEEARLAEQILQIQSKAQDQIALERDKFAAESRKLAAAFDDEKRNLAAELEQRRQQLSSVTEQVEAKNQELTKLRIQYENSRVSTLLDTMSAAKNWLNPLNEASSALIEIIRNDHDKASILEERLEAETDATFRANIIYVVYIATQNRDWLVKLFDFALAEPDSPELWSVFGVGSWNSSDKIEVMKFILRASRSLSLKHDQIGDALQVFQLAENSPRGAFSIDEQAGLVALGRDLALNVEANRNHKIYGMLAAAFFVPEAFPVVAAAIFSNPNEPAEAKDHLRGFIREIWKKEVFDAQRRHVRKALEELNFPKDPPQGLSAWSQSNKAKKLSALLTAKDLKAFVER